MAYEQFAPVSDDSRIRLASLHRLAFSRQSENFACFPPSGDCGGFPKSLHPALASLQNNKDATVAQLAALLTNHAAKPDLIKSLGVLARAGVVLVAQG